MNIKVSSAIVFTDNKLFLAVHPTGDVPTFWDLPKGVGEQGETHQETAVREFKEETGIKLEKSLLRYIGIYPLHETKDVVIFIYRVSKLPPISSLKCISTTKAYGDPVPEIDGFKYLKLSDYTKLRTGLHLPMKSVILRITDYMEN